MRETVLSFFTKHHFSVNAADYNIVSALRADMNAKLAGGKTNTWQDMNLTWMVPPENSPKNERVIVIDAGGTNFRSCLVTFDAEGKPAISDFQKTVMPGVAKELSKTAFFDAIADNIDYLKNKADRIGFCFSYSMTITKDGDGIPNSFSKEIKAGEVVGVPVGATLTAVLEKRGWNKIKHIALLNDTVAALLAGAAGNGGKRYSSYIGFILGTGMNGAYIQPAWKNEPQQIVVCENGKFGDFARSDFDEALDKKSQHPGEYMLEKCCSGGYLGALGLEVLQAAAKDGVVSAECAEALNKICDLTLIELDDFLHTANEQNSKENVISACCKDENDRAILFEILDALIERCAGYAASILAACLLQSEAGKDEPVCILCNGTTFFKTYRLRERIESYLSKYASGIRYEIISKENDITIGTATAGLV
ncbi:MAG: hexokinase [Treponema sp.]|nr:hexokinase [Treponema sp.]